VLAAQIFVAVIMIFVPGIASLSLLESRSPWKPNLAIAMGSSVAIQFIWSEILGFFGLSPVAVTQSIILLGLSGVTLFLSERARTISIASEPSLPAPIRKHLSEIAPATIAFFLLSYEYFFRKGGISALIPNNDGQNHAMMIQQIIDSKSVHPSDVFRYFPNTADSAISFYPLGLHNIAARIVNVTHLDIPSVMNVLLCCGIASFTFGLSKLASVLTGGSLLAPMLANLTAVVLSPGFPFRPLDWGGWSLIISLSLVPAVGHEFITANFAKGRTKTAVRLGLLIYALFVSHVSEALLILVLASCLLLDFDPKVRRVLVRMIGCATAISMILASPQIFSLLRGLHERSADLPTVAEPSHVLGSMFTYVGGHRMGWALLFISLGVIANKKSSVCMNGTLAFICAFGVLNYHLARNPDGIVGLIGTPWYRQTERITYNVQLMMPILVAVSLIALLRSIRLSFIRYCFLGLSVCALSFSLQSAQHQTQTQFEMQRDVTPINSDAAAAFGFIKANLQNNLRSHVLSDLPRTDGGMWMFPLQGLKPLIVDYGLGLEQDRRWRDKIHLLGALGDWSNDPRSLALIKEFNISYLFHNRRSNAISEPGVLTEGQIAKEVLLKLVWSRGTASVYQIDLASQDEPKTQS
jgi:hypothetical protein